MAEVFSISGAPVGAGGMGSVWDFVQRFQQQQNLAPPPPPPPPAYGPPPPPPPPHPSWRTRWLRSVTGMAPPPPPPPPRIPWYAQTARRGAGHFRHRTRPRHLFGYGGFGASCPPGWTQTPHGNCGGPSPPDYRNPLALNLQNALRALGRAVGGDAQLLSVSTDGVIGPATAAAVNRAFTTHIGPGQAGGVPRTGALSAYDVAAQIGPITMAVQNETSRRGGALTPPRPSGGGGGGGAYVPPPPSGGGGPSQADVTGPGIPMTTWAIVGGVAVVALGGAYFLMRPQPSYAPARRRR